MPLRLILALALLACGALAQQRTVSSSTRPGVNDNADGALEGTRPEKILAVVKAKGTVTAVDLQKRTLNLALAKTGAIELEFAQPAGREHVKAGKKAAKRIGKSRLRLEEIPVGAKVRIQYYPQISQLMEVVLD